LFLLYWRGRDWTGTAARPCIIPYTHRPITTHPKYHILTIQYHFQPALLSKNSSPNNKNPLLLPPNKLHDFIRGQRQRRFTGARGRHGVQFEDGRRPREARVRRRGLVVDLGADGVRVQRGLEVRVQGLKSEIFAHAKG
jgi:hypothetical protein